MDLRDAIAAKDFSRVLELVENEEITPKNAFMINFYMGISYLHLGQSSKGEKHLLEADCLLKKENSDCSDSSQIVDQFQKISKTLSDLYMKLERWGDYTKQATRLYDILLLKKNIPKAKEILRCIVKAYMRVFTEEDIIRGAVWTSDMIKLWHQNASQNEHATGFSDIDVLWLLLCHGKLRQKLNLPDDEKKYTNVDADGTKEMKSNMNIINSQLYITVLSMILSQIYQTRAKDDDDNDDEFLKSRLFTDSAASSKATTTTTGLLKDAVNNEYDYLKQGAAHLIIEALKKSDSGSDYRIQLYRLVNKYPNILQYEIESNIASYLQRSYFNGHILSSSLVTEEIDSLIVQYEKFMPVLKTWLGLRQYYMTSRQQIEKCLNVINCNDDGIIIYNSEDRAVAAVVFLIGAAICDWKLKIMDISQEKIDDIISLATTTTLQKDIQECYRVSVDLITLIRYPIKEENYKTSKIEQEMCTLAKLIQAKVNFIKESE
jgi:hypothetical protein